MLIVKSVTSTNVADVVENAVALPAFLTCTTPPLVDAKEKFALSDAAVKTSPAVYVVNGIAVLYPNRARSW
jgi:hypothetical protein